MPRLLGTGGRRAIQVTSFGASYDEPEGQYVVAAPLSAFDVSKPTTLLGLALIGYGAYALFFAKKRR